MHRDNVDVRDASAVGGQIPKEHLVVDRVARLQNHMSSNLEWAHKRPVGHFREGGRLED